MTYIVSITSQGQISIPAKLRGKLGMAKKQKAIVSEENGRLIIEPVTDILSLKGSLKTHKKPLSGQQLHDFVARAAAEEYAKKFKRVR